VSNVFGKPQTPPYGEAAGIKIYTKQTTFPILIFARQINSGYRLNEFVFGVLEMKKQAASSSH
jgi:hypothetical protein